MFVCVCVCVWVGGGSKCVKGHVCIWGVGGERHVCVGWGGGMCVCWRGGHVCMFVCGLGGGHVEGTCVAGHVCVCVGGGGEVCVNVCMKELMTALTTVETVCNINIYI